MRRNLPELMLNYKYYIVSTDIIQGKEHEDF